MPNNTLKIRKTRKNRRIKKVRLLGDNAKLMNTINQTNKTKTKKLGKIRHTVIRYNRNKTKKSKKDGGGSIIYENNV